MKRLFFLLVIILLYGCADDPNPLNNGFRKVKSITSYDEDTTEPLAVVTYSYDDRDRLTKITNTNPGWLSSSLTTYEYVSDYHIKVQSGSNISDILLNEHGDVIRWNDDTFTYKYEENKVTMTITSDSDTWDMIFYLSEGNVIQVEEPDFDFVQTMTYDDKPNFRKSIELNGFNSCRNNPLHESHYHQPDYPPYQVEYTYQYDENNYVVAYSKYSYQGDWSNTRSYEVTYY